MLVSAILRAAQQRLTPETWGQGEMCHSRERECAIVAIRLAAGENSDDYLSAAIVFGQTVSGLICGWDIPDWNDAPERCLQDVLDAFDAAIAIAEAQEAQARVPDQAQEEVPVCVS